MALKTARALLPALVILLITALACNLPGNAPATATPPPAVQQDVNAPQVVTPTEESLPTEEATATLAPAAPTAAINHIMRPADTIPGGQVVYDVFSEETAPEHRAPYGDSYGINRLERPFSQDMTYIPDLDIVSYTVSGDADWWYVSIELIGADPNNPMGIDYGVELDKDHDGFGDYIIWAHPPYGDAWYTTPVQIFQDTNHNTGGLSGEKSDAPFNADGYDKLIFNGGLNDADPDMAWVRINGSPIPYVQFAFKKYWSGTVFMLGVVADANFKDVQKFDLVDRMTEAEAGSPVREKQYYPLKALFAVDNACREAFGFNATGYEPQLCPREEPTTPRPHRTPVLPPPVICQPPAGGCGPGYTWYGPPVCHCLAILY